MLYCLPYSREVGVQTAVTNCNPAQYNLVSPIGQSASPNLYFVLLPDQFRCAYQSLHVLET